MITLLAPLALFASALLAIPIILHLFKPRKVRRTPFSSLRWLHLSQQKLARRIKWHQVILFLLRFAFIALLVFAIAKPVLSGSGDKAGFVERFIVLDVSRSMGYQAAGRPTPIELGKQAAAEIVKQGLAGDRTAVMLTGSTTRSLGPLLRDPAISLAALKDVKVTASDTDLGSALQVIRPMLARKRADATVELHFITDNHQRSWREGEIASFVKDLSNTPVTVRIIDVGIPAAQNAWIADARVAVQAKADAPKLIRAQVGCVGDAGQSRTIRVGGVQGLPEITKTIQLDPGNLVPVEIEIPAALDTRGQVAKLSIDPGDALPEDDEFFLTLDKAGGTKVLLVESDSSRIESLRPGFYIRAALAALSASDGRAIDLVTKNSGDVADADLADTDVVILADVPSLTDATLTALEERVKAGAGLAIFLGPAVEPTFYNTKLHKPATPSESLMPMPLGAVANAPQRLDTLTGIDWSHPLLAPLHDPVLGDFAQTLVRSYYRIEGTPAAEILAAIDEHTPAIMARSVGSGRVVVFNTTANDAWSDLPRRKSFVPLIDRLLTHLAGAAGSTSGSFAVGETVTLPLSDLKVDAAITVTGPDGKKLTPVVQSQAGRTIVRLDSVQQPGIYRIESADPSAQPHTFVVQAGRGDSVLTPIDPAALKKWWEPTNIEILSADAVAKGVAINANRIALWPWLVGLACLVFVAEMFLVHWLCPRMNPGVVAPVVPRRGLFSVESKRQEVGVN